jgi:hypothetical protein
LTIISLVSPVNREEIFETCIAASPDIVSGRLEMQAYRGCANFGVMANAALDSANSEWLMFVHQDVYLPAGFADRAEAQLGRLIAQEPSAMIAGVIGLDCEDRVVGQTWSSGMGRIVGKPLAAPVRVHTLDEMILIVKVDSGLRFDLGLPGFHLYATDLIVAAAGAGKTAWVIDLPAIHHSHRVVSFGGSYRIAYRYLQRKWRAQLPLPNLVCTVRLSIIPLLLLDLRVRLKNRGQRRRTPPKGTPSEIAKTLGWEPILPTK